MSDDSTSPEEAEANAAIIAAREAHTALIFAQAQAELSAPAAVAAVHSEGRRPS